MPNSSFANQFTQEEKYFQEVSVGNPVALEAPPPNYLKF